jgi:hypothetical protein
MLNGCTGATNICGAVLSYLEWTSAVLQETHSSVDTSIETKVCLGNTADYYIIGRAHGAVFDVTAIFIQAGTLIDDALFVDVAAVIARS